MKVAKVMLNISMRIRISLIHQSILTVRWWYLKHKYNGLLWNVMSFTIISIYPWRWERQQGFHSLTRHQWLYHQVTKRQWKTTWQGRCSRGINCTPQLNTPVEWRTKTKLGNSEVVKITNRLFKGFSTSAGNYRLPNGQEKRISCQGRVMLPCAWSHS